MRQKARVLPPHRDLSQSLSQPWLRLAQRPFPFNFRGSGGPRQPDGLGCPPSNRPCIQLLVRRTSPPFAPSAHLPTPRTQKAGSAQMCGAFPGTRTHPGPALLSGAPGPARPLPGKQSRLTPRGTGPPSGGSRPDPVWAAALGTGPKSRLQSREQGANFGKEF